MAPAKCCELLFPLSESERLSQELVVEALEGQRVRGSWAPELFDDL